jgi:hypothetical protein
VETRSRSEDIDHVNVKIFAREPISIDLADTIPVFHRWIQEVVLHELIIDVADYRHVPAGPGVMLIGNEANYSLDCAFDHLGLLYNRKRPSEGALTEKLLKAFGSALLACSHLEDEAVFRGKLKFDAGHCEVILNDRLLAPNTEETWLKLRPHFEMFFDGLFGSGRYSIRRLGERRQRFRIELNTPTQIDVRSMLEALEPA